VRFCKACVAKRNYSLPSAGTSCKLDPAVFFYLFSYFSMLQILNHVFLFTRSLLKTTRYNRAVASDVHSKCCRMVDPPQNSYHAPHNPFLFPNHQKNNFLCIARLNYVITLSKTIHFGKCYNTY